MLPVMEFGYSSRNRKLIECSFPAMSLTGNFVCTWLPAANDTDAREGTLPKQERARYAQQPTTGANFMGRSSCRRCTLDNAQANGGQTLAMPRRSSHHSLSATTAEAPPRGTEVTGRPGARVVCARQLRTRFAPRRLVDFRGR